MAVWRAAPGVSAAASGREGASYLRESVARCWTDFCMAVCIFAAVPAPELRMAAVGQTHKAGEGAVRGGGARSVRGGSGEVARA